MNITHKVNIFYDDKKWFNKRTFSSKKILEKTINDLAQKTLELGVSKSKFKKKNSFNCSISFILSNDKLLKVLNKKFLKKDKATNVLSFPNNDFQKKNINFLGEIYLAHNICYKEAKELNIPEVNRVKHLIIHGILHLLGFDHNNIKEEKKMKELESNILNLLQIKV